MKRQPKTIVSYKVVFPVENTFTKKKIITGLLAMVSVILAAGCSKSSSSTFVNPPTPGCSTNICKLTAHKWTINQCILMLIENYSRLLIGKLLSITPI